MERKCDKCQKTQDELNDQFIDLLEDSQRKCLDKICQNCIRIWKANDCKCGKKASDHKATFKHYSLMDFDKQKHQRRHLSKFTYVPQLLIEIIIEHIRNNNVRQKLEAQHIAQDYQMRKNALTYTMTASNPKKQLPAYTGQINKKNKDDDGKKPCGYQMNMEKGIKQIIDAFTNKLFNP